MQLQYHSRWVVKQHHPRGKEEKMCGKFSRREEGEEKWACHLQKRCERIAKSSEYNTSVVMLSPFHQDILVLSVDQGYRL